MRTASQPGRREKLSAATGGRGARKPRWGRGWGGGHLPAMGLLGPAVRTGACRSPRLQPLRGRLLRPRGVVGRARGRALVAPGPWRQAPGGRESAPGRRSSAPARPGSPPHRGAAGARPETAGLRAGRHGAPGAPRSSGVVGCEGARLRDARAKAFAAACDGGLGTEPSRPAAPASHLPV